ncbi:MAG: hypothetical protein CMP23_13620 [Rickettsiales bacterium]|nr:hypothetical protein [Rickettsiales bacterium]
MDHGSFSDTRGASPGALPPRATSPREREERKGSQPAAVSANFVERIVELAELPAEEEQGLDQEEVEEEQLEKAPSEKSKGNSQRQASGFKRATAVVAGSAAAGPRRLRGGAGDGEPSAAGLPALPEGAGLGGAAPGLRIRPPKRAASLQLEELLEEGLRLGIFGSYQAGLVEPMIVALSWDEFDELQMAIHLCSGDIPQLLVLKAFSAHRAAAWLVAFAEQLEGFAETDLIRVFSCNEQARRPDATAGIMELRAWHDPMSHFPVWNSAPVGSDQSEPWVVPKWMRGPCAEALGMAALAFEQSLCGDLHPHSAGADGANDRLTAALAQHGASHPALERWLLALSARADTRSGLCSARDALLEARSALSGF